MLKETRSDTILSLLQKNGSVEINQLCEMFDVTSATIRRDLDQLEKNGKIQRTRGGAILTDDTILLDPAFYLRMKINSEKKKAVATVAVSLLKDGNRVFISAGSTSQMIALALSSIQRLVVVTDAINVAFELTKHSNISTVMIGGEVISNTMGVTGTLAENMIRHFSVDVAFLGVTAVDSEGMLYHSSLLEVGSINALEEIAKRIVIVVDSSKIGQTDFIRIGRMNSRHMLITNDDAPKETLNKYRDLGVQVLLAQSLI